MEICLGLGGCRVKTKVQAGAIKGSTTALGFLDKGPGVWQTFIVTLGDLCSAPCFETGFFSNQGHLHWFCVKVKSFEEKYLQDRFSATVVTQPHKDARK